MQKTTLTLLNKLGLHARAAMKLVECASRFQATIIMRYNEQQANAKDILQTLCLGAPCHSTILFEIDGPDEIESLQSITQLIEDRFGENE